MTKIKPSVRKEKIILLGITSHSILQYYLKINQNDIPNKTNSHWYNFNTSKTTKFTLICLSSTSSYYIT